MKLGKEGRRSQVYDHVASVLPLNVNLSGCSIQLNNWSGRCVLVGKRYNAHSHLLLWRKESVIKDVRVQT